MERRVVTSRSAKYLWICLILSLSLRTVISKPIDYDMFENNDFDEYDDDEELEDEDDEFGGGDVYDFGENDDKFDDFGNDDDDAVNDAYENHPKFKSVEDHWPKKMKPTQEQIFGDEPGFHSSNIRKTKPGLYSDGELDRSRHPVKPVFHSAPQAPVPEPLYNRRPPTGAYGRPKQAYQVKKFTYGGSKTEYDNDYGASQFGAHKPVSSKSDYSPSKTKEETLSHSEYGGYGESKILESFKEAQKKSDGLHFFSSNKNDEI